MEEVAVAAVGAAEVPAADAVPSPPPIQLNLEQESAVGQMIKHLGFTEEDETQVRLDKSGDFFLLIGPAGTGKTTCCRTVATRIFDLDPDFRLAFTAPTNKAVKVLREGLKDLPNVACATTYSLLGLRLESNGMVKQLAIPEDFSIEEFDAVVIDEGSMVNMELNRIIQEAQRVNKIPFIFMGDPAQLPPVKEKLSPIWKLENRAELTKVMRHDNQILKLATHLRSKVDLPFAKLDVQADYANDEGVWRMTEPVFLATIMDHARLGRFHSGESKAIAWRNAVVTRLNWAIREVTIGDTPLPFAPGDRIIARQPCYDRKDLLLHTDEEGLVESVEVASNKLFSRYQTILIRMLPDGRKRPVYVWAVHPDDADKLNKELKELVVEAGKNRSRWRDFWALKESFHDVTLAYAVTAHRSQGSTYTSTFVDMQDILCNPERSEAFRCLYVACTRAKKQLYIKG